MGDLKSLRVGGRREDRVDSTPDTARRDAKERVIRCQLLPMLTEAELDQVDAEIVRLLKRRRR